MASRLMFTAICMVLVSMATEGLCGKNFVELGPPHSGLNLIDRPVMLSSQLLVYSLFGSSAKFYGTPGHNIVLLM